MKEVELSRVESKYDPDIEKFVFETFSLKNTLYAIKKGLI